jgi:hypothetical protein
MSKLFFRVLQFCCPVYDTDGNFLKNGKIYTYQSNTQSLTPAYTNKDGNEQHCNPIPLDDFGNCKDIFLPSGVAFNFIVKSSDGNIIATYNNFYGVDETTSII